MDGEAVGGADGLADVPIVSSVFAGVRAVDEDVGIMLAKAEEGEVDGQIAWCPVGHARQVPHVTLAAGDERISAQLTVEGYGLVERRRNLCYEVGALLILHVLCRAVGQHLQRGLESDVHGHLMDARALAHRMVVVAKEAVLHGVRHGAWRIVHRSCQHSEIRRRHVVVRLVVQWKGNTTR